MVRVTTTYGTVLKHSLLSTVYEGTRGPGKLPDDILVRKEQRCDLHGNWRGGGTPDCAYSLGISTISQLLSHLEKLDKVSTKGGAETSVAGETISNSASGSPSRGMYVEVCYS